MNYLSRKIRMMKGLEDITESDNLFIEIYSSQGECLGRLKPINKTLAVDPDIIERLMKWRTMYMEYFLTQFPVSFERTSRWLSEIVIPQDDRILFLIYDDRYQIVGNFGVCDINVETAELDNIIKGETSKTPELMFFCELALLNWIYRDLHIDKAILHVFSNNLRAIKLYEKAGFTKGKFYNLTRISNEDDIRYVNDNDGSEGEYVDFKYLEMVLAKDEFYRLHPWVKDIYKC